MRAVVYEGAEKVAIKEVEDAHIEEPTDVLIRVTSSAMCGSDLHMYDGRAGADPGLVLGHEPLGMVEEVGEAVKSVKRGDRVVVPTHLYCGYCFNCRRGRSASCLTVNPGTYGAAYGYAGMGPYRGAQAELLRVPSPTPTASSSQASPTMSSKTTSCFWPTRGSRAGMPPSLRVCTQPLL